MAAEYRVVKVYAGIDVLESCVQAATAEGWAPVGSPFRDEQMNQWCQAVTRPKPSDVNLREPGKGGRR